MITHLMQCCRLALLVPNMAALGMELPDSIHFRQVISCPGRGMQVLGC